jgi:hypothetical protein
MEMSPSLAGKIDRPVQVTEVVDPFKATAKNNT